MAQGDGGRSGQTSVFEKAPQKIFVAGQFRGDGIIAGQAGAPKILGDFPVRDFNGFFGQEFTLKAFFKSGADKQRGRDGEFGHSYFFDFLGGKNWFGHRELNVKFKYTIIFLFCLILWLKR